MTYPGANKQHSREKSFYSLVYSDQQKPVIYDIQCLTGRKFGHNLYIYKYGGGSKRSKPDFRCKIKSILILYIFCRKKKNMKDEKEKRLFHGTSPGSVEAICKENFDWRLSGKNATVFGDGSYFALNASYSHSYATRDNDSSHFMFLAKVLVGSYTNGDSGYRRPPPKQPSNPASDRYDSCVDNILNPTIFVIFDIDQCYPEYVIKYSQSTESIAPRPAPNPAPSQAALSQPKAPNAHAIRTTASKSSRTSGESSSLSPGTSLSYASGLNTVGISSYNTASASNSAKSSGYNPSSALKTSRLTITLRHNATSGSRLHHAWSTQSLNQNRRSRKKKCSVM